MPDLLEWCACFHHAGITLDPRPWNASLGSTVNFTCNVVGDIVNWLINATSSSDRAVDVLDPRVDNPGNDNIINSTLTVTANVVGITSIQCVAVSFSGLPSKLSQVVALTVQGMCGYCASVCVIDCHRVYTVTGNWI